MSGLAIGSSALGSTIQSAGPVRPSFFASSDFQSIFVFAHANFSSSVAKAMSPNFLSQELRTRLANGPVKFRLVVQIANTGGPTNDPSLVWPDDRRTVEMGTISVTSIVADSDAAQKALVFFPTALTDGIELSDDPLPALRTSAYAMSFARRQQR